ncbi:MAG: TolC family protein [Lysobacterales bacterium]
MLLLRFVVLVGAGIHALSSASAAEPLRLEDAVARALASNPSLTAEAAQLQAVQARSQRESLPPAFTIGGEVANVAGNGSLQGVDSAETTLSIGRVIELGGKRAARQMLGKAEVREQQHRAATLRIELSSLTASRFIAVLAKQQRLEYAEDRVRQSDRTRGEVAAWVTAARNPETDLQAAELALAEAELDRETAEHELASARMTLAASWGALTPDFGALAGDLQTLPTVEPFETLALRLATTPDLWASRLQADTIAARRRAAAAGAQPDLSLNLGVRRFEAFNDQGLVMSIALPLGNRLRSGYSVTQADAELAAVEARREAARFERHQALFERYQEFRHARTEVESLRARMLPIAERALATTRHGFEAGRLSFLALAQAQKTLFELREREIAAASRYHLLFTEVKRLTASAQETAQ